MQALVKLALEPEWEPRFEANSYGFRPGVDQVTDAGLQLAHPGGAYRHVVGPDRFPAARGILCLHLNSRLGERSGPKRLSERARRAASPC